MTNADFPPSALPEAERTDNHGKSESAAPPMGARRYVGLPLLFALLTVLAGVGAWNVYRSAWYQERRLSRLPLETLMRERDATDSRKPLLLYHIGNKLNEQGRYADADGYLREAVGGAPNVARYRDAWARALLGSGKTTAAFGQLSQFAGTNPNSAEAHLLLGKFYVTQNSLNRAAEELTAATTLDPKLGEAWAFLALTHQGRGEGRPAREAAEKAAALRPQNGGDRLMVAILRSEEGDSAGARPAFEEALRLTPERAVAYREYASFLLKNGAKEGERAVALAHRAVELDSRDAVAPLILGKALIAQGQESEALPYLHKAAELAPTAPAPALTLAQTLRKLGRADEAQQWTHVYKERGAALEEKQGLQAALELNSPDAHRRMARILAKEWDVEGCVRHNAAALRKAPDSPVTLAAAAGDLTAGGHPEQAVTLALRATEISRSNPAAFEALGDAYLALGKTDDAIKQYQMVLNWLPKRYPFFRAKMDAYYAAEERRVNAVSPERVSPAPSDNPAERAYRESLTAMRGQVRVLRVPPDAMKSAEEAVRLAPTDATYLRHLLRLQFHANKKKEAAETARQLLRQTPDDKMTHALLAVLLLENQAGAKELQEAESHLTSAEGDEKAAPTWRYGRGLLALRRGDGAGAARELREATRLDPRPAVTFYKLSQAEAKAGNHTASVEAMKEYTRRRDEWEAEAQALLQLGKSPDDPKVYTRATSVFASFGRDQDAAAIRAASPGRRNLQKEQQPKGND